MKKIKLKKIKNDEDKSKIQIEAEHLIELIDPKKLFRSPDDSPYITLPVEDHFETHPIESKEFEDKIDNIYFQEKGRTPDKKVHNEALKILSGQAKFGGPKKEIFTRIGRFDHNVYIDLANKKWEVIKITKKGWDVISKSRPVFERRKGMERIPRPKADGDIKDLRKFINAENENNWILIVSWLLGALHPTGPYPILVLQGEEGSAKSTLCKILRLLVDPNRSPLRSPSPSERDLMISARNSWIITLDNLSEIPEWLSNALCRLSTGGGYATRQLFTDSGEIQFDSKRPVIINGIDIPSFNNDFLDRALFINLPPIPPKKRVPEEELLREFKRACPGILDGLYSVVSKAIRNRPTVILEEPPRLADYAKWVVAAEPALPWKKGGFMSAFNENRNDIHELSLEADLVASGIKKLIEEEQKKKWSGTITELRDELETWGYVPERDIKTSAWPKGIKAFSNRVKLATRLLRNVGIAVEKGPRTSKKRPIRIQKTD